MLPKGSYHMHMERRLRAWFAITVTLGLATPVLADRWSLHPGKHWSANNKFVLRVSAYEFRPYRPKLTLKRRSKNGWQTIWAQPCPQGRPPYSAHITDDGKYVVLRDRWANLGYHDVVVFIGPTGRILRKYTLDELLPWTQTVEFFHSRSNIYWCDFDYLVEGRNEFIVHTKRAKVVFDYRTGMELPESRKKRKLPTNKAKVS